MNLTPPPLGLNFLPRPQSTTPIAPKRWTQYWKTPIAKFDYGSNSRVPLWAEAALPALSGITGAPQLALTYGGDSIEAATSAARLLTKNPIDLTFSFRNGRTRTTQVYPAIAVLRDSRAGAFWLAPLHTTVRLGDEWLDAPHSIDGPAYEGDDPVLHSPKIYSATRDLVAVVGANAIIKPERWVTAPRTIRR